MAEPKNLGRDLRALWATLAVIFAFAAVAAYAVTRYTQSELEQEATRDARKMAIDVFQPLLLPTDVQGPVRGARYEQLLEAVDEHVLAGPIDGVRLWAADGTILFADDPELVGRREPDMRDDIHATLAGTSRSSVVGERFRTLTLLQIGAPPTLVAVELGRSHTAIVDEAKERWFPWARRAGVAAAVCVVLFVATWLLFAFVGGFQRFADHRRDEARTTEAKRARERARADRGPDPAYMTPGFQEEVEARRAAEDALEEAVRERDVLVAKVKRLEAELAGANGNSGDAPVATKPWR